MTDQERLLRAARMAAMAAVLAGAVVGCGSSTGGPATQKESLKVAFYTSNALPWCSYDAPTKTVTAQLTIDGFAPKKKTVSLVVTAYADENTSQPVGSKSTFVKLDGTVHQELTVKFQVAKPPQVGEDNVAACGRELKE
jgi:hypothetical protein